MARGKGKIIAWFTRNGLHIPIYEDYTVREGHEPGESGMKTRWKTPKSVSAKFRDDIEKDITSKWHTYWKGDKDIATYDIKDTMERVDKMLDYFKDKEMIKPSDDYDKHIVWKFSGRDKSTGKYAGFEFNGYPRESDARVDLRGNGYTVSQDLILPLPIYNYLMDKTNVTDADIFAAKALMKQALKHYKSKKGIRRHG